MLHARWIQYRGNGISKQTDIRFPHNFQLGRWDAHVRGHDRSLHMLHSLHANCKVLTSQSISSLLWRVPRASHWYQISTSYSRSSLLYDKTIASMSNLLHDLSATTTASLGGTCHLFWLMKGRVWHLGVFCDQIMAHEGPEYPDAVCSNYLPRRVFWSYRTRCLLLRISVGWPTGWRWLKLGGHIHVQIQQKGFPIIFSPIDWHALQRRSNSPDENDHSCMTLSDHEGESQV